MPAIPTTTPASNPNIGFTGRMDYSTNPSGVRIPVDPATGLDIKTATSTPVTTTNPIIANQNGIMQSTTPQNTKDANTGAAIDSKVATTYQTPAYGTDVKDANGNVIGQAKFDGNTGKPLANPADQNNNNNGNTPGQSGPGTITTPDGAIYSLSQPAGFNYTLPTAPAGSKYVYGSDGHPYLQDATGKITTDPTAESEFNKNVQANKQMSDFNATVDSYKAGLDSANAALLDSIKNTAAIQTQKMEVLNKAMEGAKTVAGYRTGGAEYTPEINMGIIKNEQEEGLQRLSDIQTQMNVAIAQAVSAKNDKDFELATKTLETINTLQNQKETAIQTVYKNYVDGVKAIEEATKAATAAANTAHEGAVKDLTVSAPQLVKDYDALKPADQKAYIDTVAKKTGLDASIILGEMDKSRLATQNTNSEITNRNKPPVLSTADKNSEKVSTISAGFKPGQTFTDTKGVKTAIIDSNGYANPEAFKNGLSNSGMSRTDFIKNFGYLVYLPSAANYGLTPVEIKLITGSLNSTDGSL